MEPTVPNPMPAFAERARLLLDRAFRGIHHVESLKKTDSMWTCVHRGSLSTFDFDTLTRLVLGAHEYCVRLEIRPLGKRGFTILLHPRKTRKGAFYDEHPTIEQAIERFKTI